MARFPCGALPIDSPYYIHRHSIESLANREIAQPGSITRIKAPRQMGKSSLLLQLLDRATQQQYRTVYIDFQAADSSIYASLTKFLRWFGATVTAQLGLPNTLNDYWDTDIGAKLSCTVYFEAYLLETITTPIVIALDEVNQVFEHPDIAKDFFPLLRYWHEQGKNSESFQKLRLIIAHSTEIYIPLSINQSPFNVGLPIQLQPFDQPQVYALADRYGLTSLSASAIGQLIHLCGGHPYLTTLAFYHLQQDGGTLGQLLQTAATATGIYSHHLRRYLNHLRQNPPLAEAFSQVVQSAEPIELDATIAYQLASLGLITLHHQTCTPACELYRQYFRTQKLDRNLVTQQLKNLVAENEYLKTLVRFDSLTQIANRHYFDEYLKQQWQLLSGEKSFISLMLLDIDCFKQYNDTYGHLAGDHCLQQIAQVLRHSLKRSQDLAARYGGEEFAVILPVTNISGTQQLATTILANIAQLNMAHQNSQVAAKIVTASIGVAGLRPDRTNTPLTLIAAADSALYRAKQTGRNCVTISTERLRNDCLPYYSPI